MDTKIRLAVECKCKICAIQNTVYEAKQLIKDANKAINELKVSSAAWDVRISVMQWVSPIVVAIVLGLFIPLLYYH